MINSFLFIMPYIKKMCSLLVFTLLTTVQYYNLFAPIKNMSCTGCIDQHCASQMKINESNSFQCNYMYIFRYVHD